MALTRSTLHKIIDGELNFSNCGVAFYDYGGAGGTPRFVMCYNFDTDIVDNGAGLGVFACLYDSSGFVTGTQTLLLDQQDVGDTGADTEKARTITPIRVGHNQFICVANLGDGGDPGVNNFINRFVDVIPFDISGTTITVGTPESLSIHGDYMYSTYYDHAKVVIVGTGDGSSFGNTGNASGLIVSRSGSGASSTITEHALSSEFEATYASNPVVAKYGSANDLICVYYDTNLSALRWVLGTVSGSNVITWGTPTSFSPTISVDTPHDLGTIPTETNKLLLLSTNGIQVLTITGSSVSLGTACVPTDFNTTTYASLVEGVATNKAFYVGRGGSSLYSVAELTLNLTTDTITESDTVTGQANTGTFLSGIDKSDDGNYVGVVYLDTSGSPYDFYGYYADSDITPTFNASGTVASTGTINGTLSLGMSLEQMSNTFIWNTIYDGDSDVLLLQKRSIQSGVLVQNYVLGSGIAQEVLDETISAFPFAVGGESGSEIVYVYGRMNNPFGLGNPVHIIKTENGGTS